MGIKVPFAAVKSGYSLEAATAFTGADTATVRLVQNVLDHYGYNATDLFKNAAWIMQSVNKNVPACHEDEEGPLGDTFDTQNLFVVSPRRAGRYLMSLFLAFDQPPEERRSNVDQTYRLTLTAFGFPSGVT